MPLRSSLYIRLIGSTVTRWRLVTTVEDFRSYVCVLLKQESNNNYYLCSCKQYDGQVLFENEIKSKQNAFITEVGLEL